MSKEIERKFLVNAEKLKINTKKGVHIKQAYLINNDNIVIRIRISDNNSFLTIKSKNKGIVRNEFEYKILEKDAKEILKIFNITEYIEKTRYDIYFKNFLWQIDIFEGKNKGLIIAEIELESENQSFQLPTWVEKEITFDYKYYNSNLIKNSYTENWRLLKIKKCPKCGSNNTKKLHAYYSHTLYCVDCNFTIAFSSGTDDEIVIKYWNNIKNIKDVPSDFIQPLTKNTFFDSNGEIIK